MDLAAIADPHALEGLGLAVLPGALAVAENGAVWVSGEALRPRGTFVVTRAPRARRRRGATSSTTCTRPTGASPFPGAGFGTFIAGPSKTADIEQALVIGAHGARSCTLFLVG